jgi:hypothetical protein
MSNEKAESLLDEYHNGGVCQTSKYTTVRSIHHCTKARKSLPTSPPESPSGASKMNGDSQKLSPETAKKQEGSPLIPTTTSNIVFAANIPTPPTSRNSSDSQVPKLMSEEEAKFFKVRQDAERFSKGFDAAQQGGKSLSCKDPEFRRIMDVWKKDQLDRKPGGVTEAQQQEKKKRKWRKVFRLKPGNL